MTRGRRIRRGRSRPAFRALLTCLVALGSLCLAFLSLACRAKTGIESSEPTLRSKILELRGERTFLPRLPGVREWSPCQPPEPGSLRCSGTTDPWPSLRDAARITEWLRDHDGTRPAEPVRGLVALLSTDRSQLDLAIQDLEEAHSLQPSAWTATDLGTAYLLRSQETSRPSDLILALESTETALQTSSDLPEANFNQALILEHLHLWTAADEAWQRFAALADSEEWRSEAAQRRHRLAPFLRPPSRDDQLAELLAAHRGGSGDLAEHVAMAPQSARLYVERQLFADWARAPSDEDAAVTLASLHDIASSLACHSGDALDLEAWAAIDDAAPGSEKRLDLARGHSEFAEGMRLYDEFDFVRARDTLEQAARHLQAGGSPFAHWATFYAIVCRYYVPDYPAVLEQMADLKRRIPSRYPNLAGRIAWIEGLVQMIQGDLSQSLSSYGAARRAFQATGELEYVAYLESLIAKSLRISGFGARSWEHHLRALGARNEIYDPARRFVIVLNAAEQAESDGALRTALYLMDEQVVAAEDLDSPYVIAQAYLRRARLRAQIGEADETQEDLEAALRFIAQIQDEGNRRQARIDHRAVQGRIALAEDPARAIEWLSEAQSEYRRQSNEIDLLETYPLLARAHLELGETSRAEAQLDEAVQRIETLRHDFADAAERATFLETARVVFDAMIELQADVLEDDLSALAYVERSRNRSIGEHLTGRNPESLAWPPALLARPPSGRTVLVYRATGRKLFAWQVDSRGIRELGLDSSRDEVEQLALGFRRLLIDRADPVAIRRQAERLGLRLLRGVEVAPGRRLVVIPDRIFAGIPFSALVHPANSRYLIEDWPVTVAPRLAALRAQGPAESGAADSAASSSEALQALVVADPTLVAGQFPELRPLSGASREGYGLLETYPSATLLHGGTATKEAFLRELPRNRIVHFGGHALADAPERSYQGLVFASSPNLENPDLEEVVLRPEEIRELDARHVELAVLAACDTATGYYPRTEEISSVASAFLAAGVPSVVSALWGVDDEVGQRLAAGFHTEYARSRDAAEALRRTQLDFLARPEAELASPAAWAVLQLLESGRSSVARPPNM